MKYEVQTKFVFSGTFTVEAKSAAQARRLVRRDCQLAIGRDIHTNLKDEYCDWEFKINADTITGRIRRIK